MKKPMKQLKVIRNKTAIGTKPFYNSTIPSDWTTPKFGEVFSFLKSFSFSRAQLTNEKTVDEIQNIHYGDIHATFENEILDFEIETRIPFVVDGLISKKVLADEEFPLLKDGDLIIADASEDTVGVAECVELKNVNGRKIISGLHTFAARDKNGKTAAGYRTYILKHPQVLRELKKIATGFSVYGISKTNLAILKLPLPPQKEQEEIADLLHLMDIAINKNNFLISKKELQKKWLLRKLFSGEKRLKGFKKNKWKEVRLHDVAEIDKLSLGNQTPDNYSFQYLSLSGVDSGDPEIKSERIIFKHAPSRARRIVSKGDVLLSTVRPNLQGFVIIRDDVKDFIASTGFAVITCTKINNEFLFQYCFTRNLMKQIESFLVGSNYPAINSSDVKHLKIPFPAYEEQIAIAKVLQAADREIQLLKTKTEKLREKKKGLLQQLLTGKKRLK
jgi:type I restriction enzyme, S subunit